MRIELNEQQARIAAAALRTWIEDRSTSLREGTYSAIDAERVKVALQILDLLEIAELLNAGPGAGRQAKPG